MGNDNDVVRRDNFLGNDNQGVGDEIMTTMFVKEELLPRQLVYTLDSAHFFKNNLEEIDF